MAWRMGQWDLPAASVSDSNSTAGFHGAVYSGLAALRAGDAGQLATVVSCATHDCVRQLATAAGESVAAVNPGLLRLQMLQALAGPLAAGSGEPGE